MMNGDGQQSGRPKRILVVDDDKNQVATLVHLLTKSGYEVRGTNDAPSALMELREFDPDYALIDIGLPGLIGYDLARLIRSENKFSHTVLIAQTCWAGEEDRARGVCSIPTWCAQ